MKARLQRPLTPLDRGAMRFDGVVSQNLHFRFPNDSEWWFESRMLSERMRKTAKKIALEAQETSFCLDLAVAGDSLEHSPIVAIEFNPLQPGQVGLFACDPYALAQSILNDLPQNLRKIMKARRDGHEPALTVESPARQNQERTWSPPGIAVPSFAQFCEDYQEEKPAPPRPDFAP